MALGESIFDKLSHGAQTAAHELRIRQTALHPMLWLCAIITPITLGAAYFFSDPLQSILVYIGILPVIITCVGFVYFVIFNPEKLQSEEYQIRHEAMQVLQIKAGPIGVTDASLNEIAGTVVPQPVNLSEAE